MFELTIAEGPPYPSGGPGPPVRLWTLCVEAGDRDAAQSLMEAADVSGDQQIDYREFIAATMQRQLYLREENVRKVFEHLDVDDSGDISVENLVALTGSKKKAEELIGEGDLDHSKTISYEEFKKLMHTAS